MILKSSGCEVDINFAEFDYVAYEGDEHPHVEMNLYYKNQGLELYFDHEVVVDWIYKIISEINKTINGKYEEKHIVKFYCSEEHCNNYDEDFDIVIHGHENHIDDYWEIRLFTQGFKNNSGQADLSIFLNIDDITDLRDDIYTKVKALDLTDVGKIEYYILKEPKEAGQYCYSALELKEIIESACRGRTLEKVFVSLESSYFCIDDYSDYYSNWYDRGLILSFGDIAISLGIHAEGMFEYQILEEFDEQIIEKVYARVRFDKYTHFDIQQRFDTQFSGEKVVSVDVSSTQHYPFNIAGYDRNEAKKSKELPSTITFRLGNNKYLKVIGSCIEYYSLDAGIV